MKLEVLCNLPKIAQLLFVLSPHLKMKPPNLLDYIRHLKAPIRFISCEPLLEDLGELDLKGINWVIVGGESGVQARPMKEEWVLNIKRQAETNHIPFFFKQWGTWSADGVKSNKKVNGKLLQGVVIQNMPTIKK